MAKTVKDPELKAGLTQARKNPRNYVLIAQGTAAVKLIVQKKPIIAGDVQKAKTASKGNLVIEGVCVGDGPEMVFQVMGEEPSVKVLTIKELIDEETELTMKGRFQVVTEFAKIPEKDAPEGNEQQPTSTTNEIPQAPPLPPPPVELSADDKELLAQLKADMSKLGPKIQEAMKKSPQKQGELLAGVTVFKQHINPASMNLEEAETALNNVSSLVEQVLGAAGQQQNAPQQQAPPQQPPADPKAAQWEREWSQLEPNYLAALQTASSDLASKLRVIHAYATEQAEATQYDKALAALVRLRPLIEQAALGKGAAGEVVAGTVEKRKYMIDRIKKLPVEIRPELDKLKAAIATQVPDEDAEGLCGEIEIALQEMFNLMQDEIDAAINKGDMKVIGGMKNRITANELVKHLVSNPMTQGVQFRNVIMKALEEVETKLAG